MGGAGVVTHSTRTPGHPPACPVPPPACCRAAQGFGHALASQRLFLSALTFLSPEGTSPISQISRKFLTKGVPLKFLSLLCCETELEFFQMIFLVGEAFGRRVSLSAPT